MAKICLHAIVTGRVQGVWFRRFTQEQAEANQVTGWVRNRPDGSVEALLCGEEKSVRHVEAWLNKGPELANVAEVVSTLQEWDDQYTAFTILRERE
ncbi:acylphosphatase [Nitrincola alkalilacustris]|uniref:acylphosphatase n=1 Tax=Nitrincola alkalilacustris TaxID=1571224 RepID=UPI00124BCCD9|nr:acylphosphatase [Nitrincola alkalilacustris]